MSGRWVTRVLPALSAVMLAVVACTLIANRHDPLVAPLRPAGAIAVGVLYLFVGGGQAWLACRRR